MLLAASMKNKGTLVLGDIHPWRLAKAQERLKRAGVHNHRSQILPDNTWLKRQTGTFDRVLVDAPCSGTGTWRRNPDLKLKFTQKDLENLVQEQQTILKTAALLVKPGGLLVYATCSVLRRENHQQVAIFLETHPDFALFDGAHLWAKNTTTPWPSLEKMLQLFPHKHETDGFFVACLKKS